MEENTMHEFEPQEPEFYTVSVRVNETNQITSWGTDSDYGTMAIDVPNEEWNRFSICGGQKYKVNNGALIYDETLPEIPAEILLDEITQLQLAIAELYERML